MYEEDYDYEQNQDWEHDELVDHTVSGGNEADNSLEDTDDIVNRNDAQDDIVNNHEEAIDDNHNTDEKINTTNKGADIPFLGQGGWECRCSGSCLCRYYEPKSTYNTDCMYCLHPLSWHKKR